MSSSVSTGLYGGTLSQAAMVGTESSLIPQGSCGLYSIFGILLLFMSYIVKDIVLDIYAYIYTHIYIQALRDEHQTNCCLAAHPVQFPWANTHGKFLFYNNTYLCIKVCGFPAHIRQYLIETFVFKSVDTETILIFVQYCINQVNL